MRKFVYCCAAVCDLRGTTESAHHRNTFKHMAHTHRIEFKLHLLSSKHFMVKYEVFNFRNRVNRFMSIINYVGHIYIS